MCKFITDLFFTNVGLVLPFVYELSGSGISGMTQKKKCLNFMFFSRIPFLSPKLSTCLTGWVYDQELGLYLVNRVEALLLNQIPCGILICTASVDFICWNCAFDIVICLFLDLDSMSAQFFQTSLQ